MRSVPGIYKSSLDVEQDGKNGKSIELRGSKTQSIRNFSGEVIFLTRRRGPEMARPYIHNFTSQMIFF